MVTEPLKWYDENADNPVWGESLGRGPAQGDPRRLVLPPRSGNHRRDGPVRRSGLGEQGVLSESAL